MKKLAYNHFQFDDIDDTVPPIEDALTDLFSALDTESADFWGKYLCGRVDCSGISCEECPLRTIVDLLDYTKNYTLALLQGDILPALSHENTFDELIKAEGWVKQNG